MKSQDLKHAMELLKEYEALREGMKKLEAMELTGVKFYGFLNGAEIRFTADYAMVDIDPVLAALLDMLSCRVDVIKDTLAALDVDMTQEEAL
jgi:hypothetical protein